MVLFYQSTYQSMSWPHSALLMIPMRTCLLALTVQIILSNVFYYFLCKFKMFYLLFFIIVALGYIVTFTKLHTLCHSWIYYSITLLYPLPLSWNSFNRKLFSHFQTWLHSIFIISSPDYPFLILLFPFFYVFLFFVTHYLVV
jgi:hypothetical protein